MSMSDTFAAPPGVTVHASTGGRSRAAAVWDSLRAQPPATRPLTDPAEIDRTYRYWRRRTMVALFVGYATYYLVRKNLSAATPALIADLSLTKTQVGAIWSALYLSYGIGKFGNGILGDKSNPRYFMAIGLVLSALMNIAFGMSSGFAALMVFWTLNGWFQSMGWPPCARSLTHWYGARERGTQWGIWNASHQVGGALILGMAGWLTAHWGWRSAFFVPAALSLGLALFLVRQLRDTPSSLGLPPIETWRGEATNDPAPEAGTLSTREILFEHVLCNRAIWLLGAGNFFVYLVRYGAMDWAPTFLVEVKGANIVSASGTVAGFELVGIAGAFAAGWASDKFFGARRGPLNVIYMVLLAAAVVIFWLTPAASPWLASGTLAVVGFLVYGPQMLVGVAAADAASKHAAATATGFTGFAGYMGSIVSGVGAGWIVDNYGWDGGFIFFAGCAVAGAVCFLATCLPGLAGGAPTAGGSKAKAAAR